VRGADHVFPVRVYWEDTDAGGIVYHASYLRFLERGRTEMLRSQGIEQQAIFVEQKAAFVLRQMSIDFIRSARLDDLLEIRTSVESIGGASIRLAQEVRRGEETLVAATMTVAFVSAGKPRRLPPELGARLTAPRPAERG
jgi:acyl-CoA thioester hydrolase